MDIKRLNVTKRLIYNIYYTHMIVYLGYWLGTGILYGPILCTKQFVGSDLVSLRLSRCRLGRLPPLLVVASCGDAGRRRC